MEGEAHVGDEQVANKNQRVSKPLTGDRHHEHGVMNTFNAEATRTWCKEVTKRVFGHRFVFIIDIVKFFTATKKILIGLQFGNASANLRLNVFIACKG